MAKVKLLDPSDQKRRLDRYELIGELASGGMATVYLARIAGVGGFQRFVAIKRLHPHLAGEQEFIEMFLDEARLAAGIHHPNVVPILEVGQSDSGYYLVMEYIEGDTLARIVARALSQGKEVPRPILFRILLDSLSGLHAAHDLADDHGKLVELVHRDCSPQNILVGVDGCSRITDFGVARASSRLSSTRVDRVKGKLAYMSPEQAQGDTKLDRRSDVFAMGVIFWEVLTGRRLFKADTDAGTMRKVMLEPIARLSSVMPGVHRAVDDVCSRALERDLSRRFQSAAELGDAIERAASQAAPAGSSGVASPREVAAYVQGALGQDIAAQRECVRAWLSQSEPSMPAATPVLRGGVQDVTFKVPLEKPGAPARGMAPTLPEARGPALMTLPQARAAAQALRARAAALALRDSADPDDENDTLLMVRDGQKPANDEELEELDPAPSTLPREGPSAPLSPQDPRLAATALSRAPGPLRRRRAGGLVALVALILLGAGVGVWLKLRPSPAAADEKTAATSTPAASGAPSAPAPSAPPASSPSAPSSPSAAAEPPPAPPAAGADSAQPSASPAHGGGKPWHRGGKAPSASLPKTAEPATPPPPGGEDQANPYR